MNTNTRTPRIGLATASLLGLVLVLVPNTAHANETHAARAGGGAIVRIVPNDLDPRGHHVVRSTVPVDRGSAASANERNVRQQVEADRGSPAAVVTPRSVPNDLDPRGHHRLPASPQPEAPSQSSDTPAPTPRSFPGDVDPRGYHGLSRAEQLQQD